MGCGQCNQVILVHQLLRNYSNYSDLSRVNIGTEVIEYVQFRTACMIVVL